LRIINVVFFSWVKHHKIKHEFPKANTKYKTIAG